MDGHEAAALRREEWFRTARQKLNERFAAEGSPPATDDDWRLVLAVHAGDYGFLPGEEDDLAELAYGLIVFYRKRAEAEGRDPVSATSRVGSTTSVDAPAWWVEESSRLLESAFVPRLCLRAAIGLWAPPGDGDKYVSPLVFPDENWLQSVLLNSVLEHRAGLDYSTPLDGLDDLKPFLLEQAEKQPHEGARRTLKYLTTDLAPAEAVANPMVIVRGGRGFFVGETTVYAGTYPRLVVGAKPRSDFLDNIFLALGLPAENRPEASMDIARWFESVPTLEYLRGMSEYYALRLGVNPGEVTAWFLCDHEIVAPWIDIHVASRFGKVFGTAADMRMVVDIGSLAVSPDALARTYSDFRIGMLTLYGEDGLPDTPDDWEVRRRQFMAEWRNQHERAEWKAAWAEWQSRYPDSKWRKFRSFRNADYAGKGAKP